jgi:hypothetical protein
MAVGMQRGGETPGMQALEGGIALCRFGSSSCWSRYSSVSLLILKMQTRLHSLLETVLLPMSQIIGRLTFSMLV